MARPEIRATVAWIFPNGDVRLNADVTCSLEEAADFSRLGFVVLIDPETEAALAQHEREMRTPPKKRSWLR